MSWLTQGRRPSPVIFRYLLPGEQTLHIARVHPAAFLGSVTLALAGLLGAVVLTATVATGDGLAQAVIWILWAVLLLRVIWKVINWRVRYFVITSHRLMLVSGLLDKTAEMMPLAEVTDLEMRRSFVGRVLGYGEFVVESAGQDPALRHVPFVPYPEQLYLEICDMIFQEAPSSSGPSSSSGPLPSSRPPGPAGPPPHSGPPPPSPGSPWFPGSSEPPEPEHAWLPRPKPPRKPSSGAARHFENDQRS